MCPGRTGRRRGQWRGLGDQRQVDRRRGQAGDRLVRAVGDDETETIARAHTQGGTRDRASDRASRELDARGDVDNHVHRVEADFLDGVRFGREELRQRLDPQLHRRTWREPLRHAGARRGRRLLRRGRLATATTDHEQNQRAGHTEAGSFAEVHANANTTGRRPWHGPPSVVLLEAAAGTRRHS